MIEITSRKNLLAIAEAFAKARGLSLSTVSRKFHGNQAFLADFKAGECSVTMSTYDAMIAAFQHEWPEGAVWPATRAALISRPGKKIRVGKRRLA